MAQKIQVYKNVNENSPVFGKYFVRPVYDDKYITTEDLADFIQMQATVKRSDCKAVLDELGSAFKHFFELGQKIKLDNIGIFKVGVKSSPSDTLAQLCPYLSVLLAFTVASADLFPSLGTTNFYFSPEGHLLISKHLVDFRRLLLRRAA